MEKKLAKKEPKVRALEALVAEMITAEEAGASEGKVRELEALVAEMLTTEEAGAKEAKVRELEALVADMVNTDELTASQALVRELEALVAELGDADEVADFNSPTRAPNAENSPRSPSTDLSVKTAASLKAVLSSCSRRSMRTRSRPCSSWPASTDLANSVTS